MLDAIPPAVETNGLPRSNICEEFYERWSVDENWCEKCPEAVREINNYIDFISRLETTYGIDKQQAMAGITERAARPLIREKDPEVKERSVLEVANRLNRDLVLILDLSIKSLVNPGKSFGIIARQRLLDCSLYLIQRSGNVTLGPPHI